MESPQSPQKPPESPRNGGEEAVWRLQQDRLQEWRVQKLTPNLKKANNPEDLRQYDEDADEWVQPYFHAAPTSERARIQTHGLMPSRPILHPQWGAEYRRMVDLGRDNPVIQQFVDQPEAVYLAPEPKHVMGGGEQRQRKQGIDIWRVDPRYIEDWNGDPLFPNTGMLAVRHPIPPEALSMHEPAEAYNWKFHEPAQNQPERWNKRYFEQNKDAWGIGQPTASAALREFVADYHGDSWSPKTIWPRPESDLDMPIGEQPREQDCTCEEGQKLDCPVHGMHAVNPSFEHTYDIKDPNNPADYDNKADGPRTWLQTNASAGDGDGYVRCEQGHTHWGQHGAAGLLLRHVDEDGQSRYLLQHRSPAVMEGNTWSTPGGALDSHEHPAQGAIREAEEEIGPIPNPQVTGIKTIDHGGWAYHTVHADVPEMFHAGGNRGWEQAHAAWLTPEEIDQLPLHSGFRAYWNGMRHEAASGYDIQPDTGWFDEDGEWKDRYRVVKGQTYDTLADKRGEGHSNVAYYEGEPVASVTWIQPPDGPPLLGTAFTHPAHRQRGLFNQLSELPRSQGMRDAVRWHNPMLQQKVQHWAFGPHQDPTARPLTIQEHTWDPKTWWDEEYPWSGDEQLHSFKRRRPTIYHPRTHTLHIGPGGGVHTDLQQAAGIPSRSNAGYEDRQFHGWAGHDAQSAEEHGGPNPEQDSDFNGWGWYSAEDPGEQVNQEVEQALQTPRSTGWEFNAHAHGWMRGHKGKGLVTPHGTVYTWTVSEDGMPHHGEYMDLYHPYDLNEGHGHFFQIKPRGGLDTEGYNMPPEIIDLVLKSDPRLHAGPHTDWHFEAKETLPQQTRRWEELKPHPRSGRSTVIHEFPDGWTVQEHPTKFAVQAVGQMMNNCWQGKAPHLDREGNLVSQGRPGIDAIKHFQALHDENDIPRVAFYVNEFPDKRYENGQFVYDGYNTGDKRIHQPWGVRNKEVTPEEHARLLDYAEAHGIPKNFTIPKELPPEGEPVPAQIGEPVPAGGPVAHVLAGWKARMAADKFDTREYPDTRMMPATTMDQPAQGLPHPEQKGCTCSEGHKLDCPVHGMHPDESQQKYDHLWSIPEGHPVGYPQDQPKNYMKAEGAAKTHEFSTEEAQHWADEIKMDKSIPVEQLRKGLKVELEHSDVTGGDEKTTAEIAHAHLKELPDYYDRLEKMEKSAAQGDQINHALGRPGKGMLDPEGFIHTWETDGYDGHPSHFQYAQKVFGLNHPKGMVEMTQEEGARADPHGGEWQGQPTTFWDTAFNISREGRVRFYKARPEQYGQQDLSQVRKRLEDAGFEDVRWPGKDQWEFMGAIKGPREHSLAWQPGIQGKGIMFPRNIVHTWNTGELEPAVMSEPHHTGYLRDNFDIDSWTPEGHDYTMATHRFTITPEGEASPWHPELAKHGLKEPTRWQFEASHEPWFHITDNPDFAFDPEHTLNWNSTLGNMGDEPPGLFITQQPEYWLNAHDYVRPYVAEIHAPEDALDPGYKGQDRVLPAQSYDRAQIKRVIPIDEYAREEYGEPGWIEQSQDYAETPYHELPRYPNYRYEGPDVRDMSPEERAHHEQRIRRYIEEVRPHMLDTWDENGERVPFKRSAWEPEGWKAEEPYNEQGERCPICKNHRGLIELGHEVLCPECGWHGETFRSTGLDVQGLPRAEGAASPEEDEHEDNLQGDGVVLPEEPSAIRKKHKEREDEELVEESRLLDFRR